VEFWDSGVLFLEGIVYLNKCFEGEDIFDVGMFGTTFLWLWHAPQDVKTYSSRQTVCTITRVTWYGSQFEEGLLSSMYP